MPCAAHPRGTTDTQLPALPSISNDPCGVGIVSTIAGVDVSAQSLCLPHFAAKNGQASVKTPITFAP